MTLQFFDPIPQAAAMRASLAAVVPALETERLILRAPRAEDFQILRSIWLTDRSQFIGGPYNEEDAWLDFAQATAGWLLRGLGYWTVTRRTDGEVLGLIGIGQETTDPELEFGWVVTDAAEGNGFAFEACTAVRDYGFKTIGLKTLVSFIDTRNSRSIALANRLGAVDDTPDDWSHEDLVFRHINSEAAQ